MKCCNKLANVFTVLTTLGMLWLPSAVSAEDAWCYSSDGRSFYLDSDSVNADNLPKEMSYRVSVKSVLDSDGSLEKNIVYGFESQNDVMVGMTYDESAGLWKECEDFAAKVIWETMKPYMKQKHISYSDIWIW